MHKLKIPVGRSLLTLGLLVWLVLPARAVRVSYQENVTGVAADDSLQDVFPEINAAYAESKWVLAGLVDGGSRDTVNLIGQGKPGNGVALYNYAGPILLTWDLEKAATELKKISVWMYAGDGRNYHGQFSVSKDGKAFQTIPGSLVKKEFPVGKEATRLLHRIDWTFEPNEARDFRYLRMEVLGFPGQISQIQEVDAVIDGVRPGKSTDIHTTIRTLEASEVPTRVLADQTATAPMRVRGIKFSKGQVVLEEDGRTVLEVGDLIADPGKEWARETERLEEKTLVYTDHRKDGLKRTCRLVIDKENRLNVEVRIYLDAKAGRSASYGTTTLVFREGRMKYDGTIWGSGCGPIFIPRQQGTASEIGVRTPYLIFPCEKAGIELQMFMPGYEAMGRNTAFETGGLARWDLHAATRNTTAELKDPKEKLDRGRWHPKAKEFRPVEELVYRMTIGVFSITPRTLGQRDIEEGGLFNPLIGIEAGTGNQQVQGRPRVLHRDKMVFMGFKLPEPVKAKPGHQLQLEPASDPRPYLDRFAQSGVGVLTLLSDYRDVSHGVSWQGDYDRSPPGFTELLAEIHRRGMKAIAWFSPRGFLQKDWGSIPKDAMVEKHPDWFTNDSHWFGYYRNVDIFNPAPNEWTRAKMRRDLERFPNLSGFSYDCFPSAGLELDSRTGISAVVSEMRWLKAFSETIWSMGEDKLVVSNGGPPGYDNCLYYNFTASEHPLLMFGNEVTAGQMAFGHTYVPWEWFGQLYFWYTVVGHFYYNFCDYDQAVGWVGPSWIGMERGQMEKDYDVEVAPLWRLMGKGRRVFGARIGPEVRQVEVRTPEGEKVVAVCSMNRVETSVRVVPQRVGAGKFRVAVTVDTARKHSDVHVFDVDMGLQPGFEIKRLPPYSIALFRFTPK